MELEVRFGFMPSDVELFAPHVTVTLCDEAGLMLPQSKSEEFLTDMFKKGDVVFVIYVAGLPHHCHREAATPSFTKPF